MEDSSAIVNVVVAPLHSLGFKPDSMSSMLSMVCIRKESHGIICEEGKQRFKYSTETHATSIGTIEEEQIDERGNGDSLVPKYVQVEYRVKMADTRQERQRKYKMRKSLARQ
jgi:hypothetical protein